MCVAVPTDRNNISLTTYASVTNRVESHYRHRRVARKLIPQSQLARTHYSTTLISRKDKSTANKIHHFLIVKQDKIRNYPNKCGIDDFRKSFGSIKKKPAHLSQKKVTTITKQSILQRLKRMKRLQASLRHCCCLEC